MIRMAVLPYARPGIVGGAMLGLGRAIGETIAVTIVIGNAPSIGKSLFDQGYTLAAVIANEFGEAASDPVHRAALIAAGLVLFVLTFIVNGVARVLVNRGRHERRAPDGGDAVTATQAAAALATPEASAPSPARRGPGTPALGWPHERRSRRHQQGPRAQGPHRPGDARARHGHRARAAFPDHLLPAEEGARRLELALLHDRPDGELPRRPGGREVGHPRDDRDGRDRSGDRDPDRRRRRAVSHRVRRRRAAGQGRALPHRRDDRRAVDRLRPVHLHLAGGHRRRRLVRGVEGRARPVAADAAGGRTRGGGRAAARATVAARGRPGPRSAALAGRPAGRAAHRAAGDHHRHDARGRPCGRRDGAAAVHRGGRQRHHHRPGPADELAARPDLPGRRPSPGPPRCAGLGCGACPRHHDPAPHARRAPGPEEKPTGMSETMTESTEQQAIAARRAERTPATDAQPTRARSVEIEELNAWYGERHTIKELTLAFEPNRATALIGPSGSGKSTVVRCINRMHEEQVGGRATGQVRLDGQNVYADGVDVVAVRRAIGMVFQKPNPFPTMSIFDNVASGLRLTSRKVGREPVEKALRGAGLWEEVKDRLSSPGVGLSGGQQQRLCIARALAVNPEVILMDEPASALDPIATLKIEELVDELKHRVTIVIVTHNMQQAARVADSTAFLLDGELIEVGPTEKIFTKPDDSRTEEYVTGKFG